MIHTSGMRSAGKGEWNNTLSPLTQSLRMRKWLLYQPVKQKRVRRHSSDPIKTFSKYIHGKNGTA